jgi:hypothetical protein
MIFRKQGKLIEICRTDFKTDENYYNEIYQLQKECNRSQHVVDIDVDVGGNNTIINNTVNKPLITIQNLLLKNHSI